MRTRKQLLPAGTLSLVRTSSKLDKGVSLLFSYHLTQPEILDFNMLGDR